MPGGAEKAEECVVSRLRSVGLASRHRWEMSFRPVRRKRGSRKGPAKEGQINEIHKRECTEFSRHVGYNVGYDFCGIKKKGSGINLSP
jgi:hypothetical protein